MEEKKNEGKSEGATGDASGNSDGSGGGGKKPVRRRCSLDSEDYQRNVTAENLRKSTLKAQTTITAARASAAAAGGGGGNSSQVETKVSRIPSFRTKTDHSSISAKASVNPTTPSSSCSNSLQELHKSEQMSQPPLLQQQLSQQQSAADISTMLSDSFERQVDPRTNSSSVERQLKAPASGIPSPTVPRKINSAMINPILKSPRIGPLTSKLSSPSLVKHQSAILKSTASSPNLLQRLGKQENGAGASSSSSSNIRMSPSLPRRASEQVCSLSSTSQLQRSSTREVSTSNSNVKRSSSLLRRRSEQFGSTSSLVSSQPQRSESNVVTTSNNNSSRTSSSYRRKSENFGSNSSLICLQSLQRKPNQFGSSGSINNSPTLGRSGSKSEANASPRQQRRSLDAGSGIPVSAGGSSFQRNSTASGSTPSSSNSSQQNDLYKTPIDGLSPVCSNHRRYSEDVFQTPDSSLLLLDNQSSSSSHDIQPSNVEGFKTPRSAPHSRFGTPGTRLPSSPSLLQRKTFEISSPSKGGVRGELGSPRSGRREMSPMAKGGPHSPISGIPRGGQNLPSTGIQRSGPNSPVPQQRLDRLDPQIGGSASSVLSRIPSSASSKLQSPKMQSHRAPLTLDCTPVKRGSSVSSPTALSAIPKFPSIPLSPSISAHGNYFARKMAPVRQISEGNILSRAELAKHLKRMSTTSDLNEGAAGGMAVISTDATASADVEASDKQIEDFSSPAAAHNVISLSSVQPFETLTSPSAEDNAISLSSLRDAEELGRRPSVPKSESKKEMYISKRSLERQMYHRLSLSEDMLLGQAAAGECGSANVVRRCDFDVESSSEDQLTSSKPSESVSSKVMNVQNSNEDDLSDKRNVAESSGECRAADVEKGFGSEKGNYADVFEQKNNVDSTAANDKLENATQSEKQSEKESSSSHRRDETEESDCDLKVTENADVNILTESYAMIETENRTTADDLKVRLLSKPVPADGLRSKLRKLVDKRDEEERRRTEDVGEKGRQSDRERIKVTGGKKTADRNETERRRTEDVGEKGRQNDKESMKVSDMSEGGKKTADRNEVEGKTLSEDCDRERKSTDKSGVETADKATSELLLSGERVERKTQLAAAVGKKGNDNISGVGHNGNNSAHANTTSSRNNLVSTTTTKSSGSVEGNEGVPSCCSSSINPVSSAAAAVQEESRGEIAAAAAAVIASSGKENGDEVSTEAAAVRDKQKGENASSTHIKDRSSSISAISALIPSKDNSSSGNAKRGGSFNNALELSRQLGKSFSLENIFSKFSSRLPMFKTTTAVAEDRVTQSQEEQQQQQISAASGSKRKESSSSVSMNRQAASAASTSSPSISDMKHHRPLTRTTATSETAKAEDDAEQPSALATQRSVDATLQSSNSSSLLPPPPVAESRPKRPASTGDKLFSPTTADDQVESKVAAAAAGKRQLSSSKLVSPSARMDATAAAAFGKRLSTGSAKQVSPFADAVWEDASAVFGKRLSTGSAKQFSPFYDTDDAARGKRLSTGSNLSAFNRRRSLSASSVYSDFEHLELEYDENNAMNDSYDIISDDEVITNGRFSRNSTRRRSSRRRLSRGGAELSSRARLSVGGGGDDVIVELSESFMVAAGVTPAHVRAKGGEEKGGKGEGDGVLVELTEPEGMTPGGLSEYGHNISNDPFSPYYAIDVSTAEKRNDEKRNTERSPAHEHKTEVKLPACEAISSSAENVLSSLTENRYPSETVLSLSELENVERKMSSSELKSTIEAESKPQVFSPSEQQQQQQELKQQYEGEQQQHDEQQQQGLKQHQHEKYVKQQQLKESDHLSPSAAAIENKSIGISDEDAPLLSSCNDETAAMLVNSAAKAAAARREAAAAMRETAPVDNVCDVGVDMRRKDANRISRATTSQSETDVVDGCGAANEDSASSVSERRTNGGASRVAEVIDKQSDDRSATTTESEKCAAELSSTAVNIHQSLGGAATAVSTMTESRKITETAATRASEMAETACKQTSLPSAAAVFETAIAEEQPKTTSTETKHLPLSVDRELSGKEAAAVSLVTDVTTLKSPAAFSAASKQTTVGVAEECVSEETEEECFNNSGEMSYLSESFLNKEVGEAGRRSREGVYFCSPDADDTSYLSESFMSKEVREGGLFFSDADHTLIAESEEDFGVNSAVNLHVRKSSADEAEVTATISRPNDTVINAKEQQQQPSSELLKVARADAASLQVEHPSSLVHCSNATTEPSKADGSLSFVVEKDNSGGRDYKSDGQSLNEGKEESCDNNSLLVVEKGNDGASYKSDELPMHEGEGDRDCSSRCASQLSEFDFELAAAGVAAVAANINCEDHECPCSNNRDENNLLNLASESREQLYSADSGAHFSLGTNTASIKSGDEFGSTLSLPDLKSISDFGSREMLPQSSQSDFSDLQRLSSDLKSRSGFGSREMLPSDFDSIKAAADNISNRSDSGALFSERYSSARPGSCQSVDSESLWGHGGDDLESSISLPCSPVCCGRDEHDDELSMARENKDKEEMTQDLTLLQENGMTEDMYQLQKGMDSDSIVSQGGSGMTLLQKRDGKRLWEKGWRRSTTSRRLERLEDLERENSSKNNNATIHSHNDVDNAENQCTGSSRNSGRSSCGGDNCESHLQQKQEEGGLLSSCSVPDSSSSHNNSCSSSITTKSSSSIAKSASINSSSISENVRIKNTRSVDSCKSDVTNNSSSRDICKNKSNAQLITDDVILSGSNDLQLGNDSQPRPLLDSAEESRENGHSLVSTVNIDGQSTAKAISDDDVKTDGVVSTAESIAEYSGPICQSLSTAENEVECSKQISDLIQFSPVKDKHSEVKNQRCIAVNLSHRLSDQQHQASNTDNDTLECSSQISEHFSQSSDTTSPTLSPPNPALVLSSISSSPNACANPLTPIPATTTSSSSTDSRFAPACSEHAKVLAVAECNDDSDLTSVSFVSPQFSTYSESGEVLKSGGDSSELSSQCVPNSVCEKNVSDGNSKYQSSHQRKQSGVATEQSQLACDHDGGERSAGNVVVVAKAEKQLIPTAAVASGDASNADAGGAVSAEGVVTPELSDSSEDAFAGDDDGAECTQEKDLRCDHVGDEPGVGSVEQNGVAASIGDIREISGCATEQVNDHVRSSATESVENDFASDDVSASDEQQLNGSLSSPSSVVATECLPDSPNKEDQLYSTGGADETTRCRGAVKLTPSAEATEAGEVSSGETTSTAAADSSVPTEASASNASAEAPTSAGIATDGSSAADQLTSFSGEEKPLLSATLQTTTTTTATTPSEAEQSEHHDYHLLTSSLVETATAAASGGGDTTTSKSDYFFRQQPDRAETAAAPGGAAEQLEDSEKSAAAEEVTPPQLEDHGERAAAAEESKGATSQLEDSVAAVELEAVASGTAAAAAAGARKEAEGTLQLEEVGGAADNAATSAEEEELCKNCFPLIDGFSHPPEITNDQTCRVSVDEHSETEKESQDFELAAAVAYDLVETAAVEPPNLEGSGNTERASSTDESSLHLDCQVPTTVVSSLENEDPSEEMGNKPNKGGAGGEGGGVSSSNSRLNKSRDHLAVEPSPKRGKFGKGKAPAPGKPGGKQQAPKPPVDVHVTDDWKEANKVQRKQEKIETRAKDANITAAEYLASTRSFDSLTEDSSFTDPPSRVGGRGSVASSFYSEQCGGHGPRSADGSSPEEGSLLLSPPFSPPERRSREKLNYVGIDDVNLQMGIGPEEVKSGNNAALVPNSSAAAAAASHSSGSGHFQHTNESANQHDSRSKDVCAAAAGDGRWREGGSAKAAAAAAGSGERSGKNECGAAAAGGRDSAAAVVAAGESAVSSQHIHLSQQQQQRDGSSRGRECGSHSNQCKSEERAGSINTSASSASTTGGLKQQTSSASTTADSSGRLVPPGADKVKFTLGVSEPQSFQHSGIRSLEFT